MKLCIRSSQIASHIAHENSEPGSTAITSSPVSRGEKVVFGRLPTKSSKTGCNPHRGADCRRFIPASGAVRPGAAQNSGATLGVWSFLSMPVPDAAAYLSRASSSGSMGGKQPNATLPERGSPARWRQCPTTWLAQAGRRRRALCGQANAALPGEEARQGGMGIARLAAGPHPQPAWSFIDRAPPGGVARPGLYPQSPGEPFPRAGWRYTRR